MVHQQPDKILFSHFETTLNAAFECKLALEVEGYESSSENFNIPTLLKRTSKIHHVSNVKTLHLTQILLHHAVLKYLTSDLYAGN